MASLQYKIGPWIISRRWPGDSRPDTWEFYHEQYDGPGDGSPEERDPRCGVARTLDDALSAIQEIEEAAP